MVPYPTVVVHGLTDARAVLSLGTPVRLLSGRGAALYAGCGWWRAMIAEARGEFPEVPMLDLLDCADAPGQALAALRIGQHMLVLDRGTPGWNAVAAIAAGRGGAVLPERPPALDLAARGALRRLSTWLRGA